MKKNSTIFLRGNESVPNGPKTLTFFRRESVRKSTKTATN